MEKAHQLLGGQPEALRAGWWGDDGGMSWVAVEGGGTVAGVRIDVGSGPRRVQLVAGTERAYIISRARHGQGTDLRGSIM